MTDPQSKPPAKPVQDKPLFWALAGAAFAALAAALVVFATPNQNATREEAGVTPVASDGKSRREGLAANLEREAAIRAEIEREKAQGKAAVQ